MKIEILEKEYWYGDCVKYGVNMPFCAKSSLELNLEINSTPNQSMPVFLSSKGRVLWRERGFALRAKNGVIEVPDDCILTDTGGRLREAYHFAVKTYFPFHENTPNPQLFEKIQYNTWIELTFAQSQQAVLDYAKKILDNGFEPGILMIDDGWSEYYGEWTFHSGRFPNPKEMLRELHDMGFQVMLWVCPFVSADSVRYREAGKLDILIKTPQNQTYIANWWNGYSAVLDFTNPLAAKWMKKQLDDLRDLGVDGFKFDAGDASHYRFDNVTHLPAEPNIQSFLWSCFGENYDFNEFRAGFKTGGYGLLQRLCDKDHSWGKEGLASLIPDTILAGLLGYPYTCPDMVGGGEYLSFQNAEVLDEELFVAHAQIAALMPAMQFSALPAGIFRGENLKSIQRSIALRKKYLPYLMEQIAAVPKNYEPIVRCMAYEFPDEGAEEITDQYMLGSDYLVAPIYKKGERERRVYLPRGKWEHEGKLLESEGEYRCFAALPGESIVLKKKRSIIFFPKRVI